MTTVISSFQEDPPGFPGGFFQYGDKNKDGKITQKDIDQNLNMAWLTEYYDLMKNGPEHIKRDGVITEQDYFKLLTSSGTSIYQGIL